ncbi:MAG: hypothetical protein M1829_004412 [Trizodia sp. TS-e1964]|nr:MAG: hypothetical protein M1829_004412 [Trizodia sp. TS-e1964]
MDTPPDNSSDLPPSTNHSPPPEKLNGLGAIDNSVSTEYPEVINPKVIFLAFSGLAVINLSAALDTTSIGVALPIITNELHGSALEAFWSGTSFLLTSTVFQPLIGSLSHIFGRKPLILINLAVFALGLIIAAVAQNFTTLLAGRSIQGVGGGGLIVLTEIIVTDLVPLRERGKFFGLIASMWAFGTVAGPLVGAGFAQNVSWRWLFYINLPLCAVGFILLPLYLHLNFKPTSLMSKLKRVDWVGSFIFIGSTTSFILSITFGGIMFPWNSWRILLPQIIGVVGLVVFYFYERYVASEPMIRLQVFKQRTAAANYFGTFLHGMILWCLIYFLPLYYQGVKDQTPIESAIANFPETFTIAPVAALTGLAVTATGKFRWALWLGWLLTSLGSGLLLLLTVTVSTSVWVSVNVIIGLGLGFLFPALAYAIQAASASGDVAYAVSMFTFFRAFGQTFGVAIGGVIFQNGLRSWLSDYPGLSDLAQGYSEDAVGIVQLIKQLPVGEQRDQVVESYAGALRRVWLFLTAFAVLGLLSSAFTESLSIDKEFNSEQSVKAKKGKKTSKTDTGEVKEEEIAVFYGCRQRGPSGGPNYSFKVKTRILGLLTSPTQPCALSTYAVAAQWCSLTYNQTNARYLSLFSQGAEALRASALGDKVARELDSEFAEEADFGNMLEGFEALAVRNLLGSERWVAGEKLKLWVKRNKARVIEGGEGGRGETQG